MGNKTLHLHYQLNSGKVLGRALGTIVLLQQKATHQLSDLIISTLTKGLLLGALALQGLHAFADTVYPSPDLTVNRTLNTFTASSLEPTSIYSNTWRAWDGKIERYLYSNIPGIASRYVGGGWHTNNQEAPTSKIRAYQVGGTIIVTGSIHKMEGRTSWDNDYSLINSGVTILSPIQETSYQITIQQRDAAQITPSNFNLGANFHYYAETYAYDSYYGSYMNEESRVWPHTPGDSFTNQEFESFLIEQGTVSHSYNSYNDAPLSNHYPTVAKAALNALANFNLATADYPSPYNSLKEFIQDFKPQQPGSVSKTAAFPSWEAPDTPDTLPEKQLSDEISRKFEFAKNHYATHCTDARNWLLTQATADMGSYDYEFIYNIPVSIQSEILTSQPLYPADLTKPSISNNGQFTWDKDGSDNGTEAYAQPTTVSIHHNQSIGKSKAFTQNGSTHYTHIVWDFHNGNAHNAYGTFTQVIPINPDWVGYTFKLDHFEFGRHRNHHTTGGPSWNDFTSYYTNAASTFTVQPWKPAPTGDFNPKNSEIGTYLKFDNISNTIFENGHSWELTIQKPTGETVAKGIVSTQTELNQLWFIPNDSAYAANGYKCIGKILTADNAFHQPTTPITKTFNVTAPPKSPPSLTVHRLGELDTDEIPDGIIPAGHYTYAGDTIVLNMDAYNIEHQEPIKKIWIKTIAPNGEKPDIIITDNSNNPKDKDPATHRILHDYPLVLSDTGTYTINITAHNDDDDFIVHDRSKKTFTITVGAPTRHIRIRAEHQHNPNLGIWFENSSTERIITVPNPRGPIQ